MGGGDGGTALTRRTNFWQRTKEQDFQVDQFSRLIPSEDSTMCEGSGYENIHKGRSRFCGGGN